MTEAANLARLSAAATDSDIHVLPHCDNPARVKLTIQRSVLGSFDKADGEKLATLWNLHRSGRLVPLPSVEELARVICQADGDCPCAVSCHREGDIFHTMATAIHNHLKGTGDAN